MNTKKLGTLILSVGIVILGCEKSTTIKTTRDLKGFVYDVYNLPVAGATVILDSVNNVLTDNDGIFTFLDVEPVKYQITVKKRGYQKVSQIAGLFAEESEPVRITLHSFTPVLTLSENVIDVPNSSDSTNIKISANYAWKADNNSPGWLDLFVRSGKTDTTISLIWTANICDSARTGIIYFADEFDTLKTIKVTQAPGAIPYLTVDWKTYNVDYYAGMSDIFIRSNVKWSLRVNEWFTCTPKSGYNDGWILVTWAENPYPRTINGIITITGEGGVSEVVTYSQDSYIPPYVPCPPCCSN